MSHAPANILPLRPRDHEDAARVAISWLAERHRKGWRNAFEALAGSAVQHLAREITDPARSLARVHDDRGAETAVAAASPASGPSPEVLAQALEQVIRRRYAHWCDETIPALGGLMPRQAITTSTGLERVKGLLREYEDGERRQSAAQGRPAVSYQFLWDALGISG